MMGGRQFEGPKRPSASRRVPPSTSGTARWRCLKIASGDQGDHMASIASASPDQTKPPETHAASAPHYTQASSSCDIEGKQVWASRPSIPLDSLGESPASVLQQSRYFAQLFSRNEEHEEEAHIWVGTFPRELDSAGAALAIVKEQCLIPDGLAATLEIERLATLGTADGPQQADMKPRFMHRPPN